MSFSIHLRIEIAVSLVAFMSWVAYDEVNPFVVKSIAYSLVPDWVVEHLGP